MFVAPEPTFVEDAVRVSCRILPVGLGTGFSCLGSEIPTFCTRDDDNTLCATLYFKRRLTEGVLHHVATQGGDPGLDLSCPDVLSDIRCRVFVLPKSANHMDCVDLWNQFGRRVPHGSFHCVNHQIERFLTFGPVSDALLDVSNTDKNGCRHRRASLRYQVLSRSTNVADNCHCVF
ncbi:MAG: hypothetical protein CMQ05_02010 [Gammaproteobacteria bacterium]|nr:hypothetical protein [Gammaproteobacteria bacterium]